MSLSSTEIISLIAWVSAIFLIAPGFLIVYVVVYNRRKKRHQEEKEQLQQRFRHELLQSQMEVQEQTLKMIGNDLHDNINQLLGLIVITLSAVDIENKPKATERIQAAEALARRSIQEIRGLSRLLHGEELIGKGLQNAITFELEWLEKAGHHQVTHTGHLDGMPAMPEQELIIFRIFQETLHNIIRHAQATAITVEQQYEQKLLRIGITDNGTGFDVNAALSKGTGMGLSSILRRAAMVGASVDIRSTPGAGTTVIITLPT
ncbi:sensor histidine kinase [Chitinophaga sp. Cy-1792]|uniref:sensor histidine kinase n=1 Tax=Chitinophaga sp. Cy-1792 TaxID=2608339 RepID=UPI0014211F8F|nr:sensor histidine kinase [Chitinophaga sp. Cy-1792]NIG56688.1 sensor histidine kinase [Chitinophaga sp. Cy-1792]